MNALVFIKGAGYQKVPVYDFLEANNSVSNGLRFNIQGAS